MSAPLRLIVLARDQSRHVQDAWRDIKAFLDDQPGAEVLAAAVTEDLTLDGLDPEIAVVLGGDGAILRACRQFGRRQIPLLGVNLGRLGFLADLSPEEFREQFPRLRERKYAVVEHLMLECTVRFADGRTETHLGLNEVLLSSTTLRMMSVDLHIGGELVTTYSGDGLILATPVGSTAHSLSAGGPILRQDLPAFVITPICPHTLTNRPLVDSADCVYRLTLPHAPDGVIGVIDGQIRFPLRSGDEVEVRRAEETFQLVKLPGHSYYAMLHRKLGWSGQPRYRRE
ncbi:MAG TPA: NAD(+)/NADH kinase [Planctomycetaceae bacterium]